MEHIFSKPGSKGKGPAPPSRGAIAGVKADMEKAKQGDYDPKNPNGTGMAWTHNFLNQKPWHPMSFKNRMKVWEHQQDKFEQDNIKEKAQAEFDTEQEYLKTLSYLSPEEQRKYREVASVSFMYQKPPGLDAALARDAELEKKKAAAAAQPAALEGAAAAAGGSGAPAAATAAAGAAGGGAAAAATGPGGPPAKQARDADLERTAMVDRLREDPYAAMLAAKAALHNNPKFAMAPARDVGTFGGYSADAHNQQLLADEPGAGPSGQDGTAELDFLLSLPADQQLKALKRIARKRKKEEEERKLREAEEVLRAAGYDLSAMAAGGGGGGGKSGGGGGSKHKKKRSKGKGHKSKEEDKARKAKKRRRGSGSESGSGSGSESSDGR